MEAFILLIIPPLSNEFEGFRAILKEALDEVDLCEPNGAEIMSNDGLGVDLL